MDGHGIRAALDFLLPAALGEIAWRFPELGPLPAADLAPLLDRAARAYAASDYATIVPRVVPEATALAALSWRLGWQRCRK